MQTSADIERAEAPTTDRRPEMQGIRILAVALIVASTFGVGSLAGGYVGLDVLLVLGGFLTAGVLLAQADNTRYIDVLGFWARRARRVLPLLTVVLVVTVVAAYLLLDDDAIDSIAAQALWAVGLASNWYFVREGTGYFDISPTSPLQHVWIISVAQQFALLLPIVFFVVLFIGARRRPNQRRYLSEPGRGRVIALTVLLVLGVAASFVYAMGTAEAGSVSFFSTLSRGWEFGVGALLAILITRTDPLPEPVRAIASWLGLAGILVAAVLTETDAAVPGLPSVLPVGATLLLLFGTIDDTRYGAGDLLRLPPLRWLGDRSLGIYLWHLPALVLATAYLDRRLTTLEAVLVVAGVVVLAIATHAAVEQPLGEAPVVRRGRRGLFLVPASVAAVLVVSMVAVDAVSSPPPVTATPPPATSTSSSAPASTTPPVDPLTAGETLAAGIVATIEAADSGDTVSSRVTDRLGGLAADTWTDGAPCISDFGATTSEICSYGPDDADQTMVIFGDEQAAMFIPTLRVVAETNGWRFYYFVKRDCTSSGARLLDAVRQNREEECDSWRQWAIDQIVELQPDITLLANDGTISITGEGDDRLTQAEQNTAWEAGMLETLQTLVPQVPKVLALSQVPIGPDPVICLDQESVLLSACTFLYGRKSESITAGTQRAVATSGAGYLDVTSLLCAGGKCPPINLSEFIYSAPGQLARTYAITLAPAMSDLLGIT